VLRALGARGIVQLMVEGGGEVLGDFIRAGLAQQLRLYVGATALGATARRWMRSPLAETIESAPRWSVLAVEQLDNDVCIDYEL
jgi:riboflavin biosynthesis pyrimidine reductase